MSALTIRDLTKTYGGRAALAGLDLDVAPQSFTVLCGPPKSGKSVLFRLLVGLEVPDRGRIELAGRDLAGTPAAARTIGYVPQSFALYPHLTVYDNIAYPLTLAGTPREDIARRVDRATGILSITHLLKKTPDQLSGGEKQRTAVARGLLKNATLFLLDDPLVGLDYKLRERLMDELKALREDLRATFLYATSDSLEALTMAQSLAVIDQGRIVQHDDALAVYHEPQHRRAFELIGFPRANLLRGEVQGGTIAAGPVRCPAPAGVADGAISVGLRPETIRHGRTADGAAGVGGQGRVRLVEDLGGDLVVYFDWDGADMVMSYPTDGAAQPALDETIAFSLDPRDILLFDAADGRRIAA